jgi:hypothetical protein
MKESEAIKLLKEYSDMKEAISANGKASPIGDFQTRVCISLNIVTTEREAVN